MLGSQCTVPSSAGKGFCSLEEKPINPRDFMGHAQSFPLCDLSSVSHALLTPTAACFHSPGFLACSPRNNLSVYKIISTGNRTVQPNRTRMTSTNMPNGQGKSPQGLNPTQRPQATKYSRERERWSSPGGARQLAVSPDDVHAGDVGWIIRSTHVCTSMYMYAITMSEKL